MKWGVEDGVSQDFFFLFILEEKTRYRCGVVHNKKCIHADEIKKVSSFLFLSRMFIRSVGRPRYSRGVLLVPFVLFVGAQVDWIWNWFEATEQLCESALGISVRRIYPV